jgi:hypothetical protein
MLNQRDSTHQTLEIAPESPWKSGGSAASMHSSLVGMSAIQALFDDFLSVRPLAHRGASMTTIIGGTAR